MLLLQYKANLYSNMTICPFEVIHQTLASLNIHEAAKLGGLLIPPSTGAPRKQRFQRPERLLVLLCARPLQLFVLQTCFLRLDWLDCGHVRFQETVHF